MSAERIAQAALKRFAAQGYDATALSEIAGDVGIRTPSIYAHFQSKRALFQHLLEEAFKREIMCLRTVLQSDASARAVMLRYLNNMPNRFESDPYLRFWLRAIYLPPPELVEEIRAYDSKFAAALEKNICDLLRHPQLGLRAAVLPHEILTTAFIGILRGIHAELLYSGRLNSQRVTSALWTVFDLSLRTLPGASASADAESNETRPASFTANRSRRLVRRFRRLAAPRCPRAACVPKNTSDPPVR